MAHKNTINTTILITIPLNHIIEVYSSSLSRIVTKFCDVTH